MEFTRRRFLRTTALSTAAAPLALVGGIDYCEAAPAQAIDWSMGFPEGAVLLNRNENPVGPSPRAVAAAQDGIARSFRYADPARIRTLLSEHHDIDRDWILVGSGSGELLSLAPLVFARDGNVVSTVEAYRSLPEYAEKLGSEIKWVNILEKKGFAYDIDGLLSAVDADTRILFMVTPNNPTGTVLSFEDMRRLADNLPRHVLLIVDEAYIHFQEGAPTGLGLLQEGYDNVLVTRTFSKAYALAGLRCGYGVGHPDIMSRISQFGCGPTSTNMAGFGAVAVSIGDEDQLRRSRKYIGDTRAFYEKNFRELGLAYASGPPNFILVDLGEQAKAVADELRERNIFVRYAGEWALPHHIRVSYGMEDENRKFFEVLRSII
jgi:histidinol-phosphate aminotransferase